MTRRRIPLIVLSVAFVLMAIGLALSWNSEAARTEREREERLESVGRDAGVLPLRDVVILVDAVRIEPTEDRVVVDIAVTLEALRTVQVGAEVAGRVVEVPVEEHGFVESGQVLVRLDAKLPEAAVARARASLVRARSAAALATQEHARQRNLSGKGIGSDAEFDRSETEEMRGDADVAEARAALVEAETRLEKTRITAPFAGTVSELDLEPGAYLRVGDPVARVSDLSEIEIEVGVDDRQILALSVGAPARLSVDAFPGRWFDGVVTGLARSPDPVTRKYPVPVRVANPDERLLPGMLGRVRFVLGDASPTLRIPRRAVYREFEVDYLYVVETEEPDDGQARTTRRRVVVEMVPFRPDLLDVKSGLEPGERIAVSGIGDLRDGLLVRVREQPAVWTDL
jgi:membrane fusion protein (multidrug efflux system)